jgi:hypothetical protein
MSNIFYCSWNHPETDETLDDLALHYEYEAAEKTTWDSPGQDECLYITKIIHDGKDIIDIFSTKDLDDISDYILDSLKDNYAPNDKCDDNIDYDRVATDYFNSMFEK